MSLKDYYAENNIELSSYYEMQEGHSISEGPGFSNANAVVKITDLDQAAAKVHELNRTSNLGAQATIKLGKVIEGLKESWRTSDSAKHISNLILIKKWCAAISSTALEVSIAAHREMENIQKTIEANGGVSASIASLTITSFGDSLKDNEPLGTVVETFIDVQIASEQSKRLRECRGMFFDFTEQYKNIKDFMLEIWQSGGARSIIEGNINTFYKQAQNFVESFDGAIKTLDQAIANWSQAASSKVGS